MTKRLTTAIATIAVLALAPAAYAGEQRGGGNNGQQAHKNQQSAPNPNKRAQKRANENAAFSNGQQNQGHRGFSNGQQGRGNTGASDGRHGRGNPGASNGRQGHGQRGGSNGGQGGRGG